MCHQAAREQWAETLWANLNIQLLQDGIEGYLKQLRKLPKEIRQMAVARSLEEKMKEFRDSLPLFVDLKHEALRERHWKELMSKTGQKFDMNPDTFTLANIFAMELHRYHDTISEIVTCASKEMGIEKVCFKKNNIIWRLKLNKIEMLSLCIILIPEIYLIYDCNLFN